MKTLFLLFLLVLFSTTCFSQEVMLEVVTDGTTDFDWVQNPGTSVWTNKGGSNACVARSYCYGPNDDDWHHYRVIDIAYEPSEYFNVPYFDSPLLKFKLDPRSGYEQGTAWSKYTLIERNP